MFDGVVFAGGGCRCFWQAGFWTVAAPALDLKPRAMSAVSAGVAFACSAVGGTLDEVLRDFMGRTAANDKNIYVHRSGLKFPHGKMYRDAILATVDDGFLEKIQSGPEIRALIAYPPPRITPKAALLLAFGAYRLDRAVRRSVHPSFGRKLGFRQQVVAANDCQSADELADLILQSSCMPPVTPQYQREGQPVIDGGIIDSSPVELLDDCESTLVLLTRRFAQLPDSPRRTYVQPSEPVPVSMWDYTNPTLLEATYDLGRRDGEAFVTRHQRRAG